MRAMLPAAFMDSVVLVPATSAEIAPLTVMLPASESAPVVLMVTDVPEFSAASMVKLVMVEPVALGVQTPPEDDPPESVDSVVVVPLPFRDDAATTVTSIGSSSQLPALPFGAAAFI